MNRAEQIESLKNEIENKKQELNELIQQEENEQYDKYLSPGENGEVEEIVNNIFNT